MSKAKSDETYVTAWCANCGGYRSVRVVDGKGTCTSCEKEVSGGKKAHRLLLLFLPIVGCIFVEGMKVMAEHGVLY